MFSIPAYIRHRRDRPYVRPWALVTPIVILVFCLPLLRPLRHPGQASVDEGLRLATISGLVENRPDGGPLADRLAIGAYSHAYSYMPHSHVIEVDGRLYSDQQPMLAFLLSGPYWVLHAMGYSLGENSVLAPYLLTLLGVTLPVAAAAGLVYRMGRIFELRRPWRTALAACTVFATGLISYAVVLNPHVPAAVLVLGAAGCLIHLAGSKTPSRGGGWLVLSGLCAALAATIDLSAIAFLLLLPGVIPAMRLRPALRVGGVILYLLGTLPPLAMYATLVLPLTGNLLPGSMHPDLSARGKTIFSEEAEPTADALTDEGDYTSGTAGEDADMPTTTPTFWQKIWRDAGRIVWTLIGEHGLLVHFPVVVLGVAGMFAVMHRHWPLTTKVLAADSAIAAGVGVIGFSLARYGPITAAFGNRWLIAFLPMLFFWTGAWLRRPHHALAWSMAGLLLAFSVVVSLIGATNPMPRGGYTRYTPAAAIHFLIDPSATGGQAVSANW